MRILTLCILLLASCVPTKEYFGIYGGDMVNVEKSGNGWKGDYAIQVSKNVQKLRVIYQYKVGDEWVTLHISDLKIPKDIRKKAEYSTGVVDSFWISDKNVILRAKIIAYKGKLFGNTVELVDTLVIK